MSFDGKLVAQGSFGDLNGDVDLWGCEGVISVHQALKNCDKLIKSVSALEKPLSKKYLPGHVTILQNISLQILKQIRHLRSKLRSDFFNRQRLFKLAQQNPDCSYGLHKVLSTINTKSADCKNVIRHALDINHDISREISKCLGVQQLIPDGHHVNLLNQANNFCLRTLQEITDIVDLGNTSNFIYIPQRSSVWHEIRRNVQLMGSTFTKAVGLNGLSAQKEHHHVFVNGRDAPEIPKEIERMLDHGINFEIRGIVTLVGQIMPALLPPCYAYFEVGCILGDTPSRSNNIAVSPDGYLQCIYDQETCRFHGVCRHKPIIVEVKSPLPQEHLPEELYYEACPPTLV